MTLKFGTAIVEPGYMDRIIARPKKQIQKTKQIGRVWDKSVIERQLRGLDRAPKDN